MIKQGHIYLANLNPQPKNRKAEMMKTRPVLVMQHQALLDVEHPSTIILPLTTKCHENVLRMRVSKRDKLEQDSDIVLDQIRAIDNSRFLNHMPIAQLSAPELNHVCRMLLNVLGISLKEE